jgi:general secretion pathway protein K
MPPRFCNLPSSRGQSSSPFFAGPRTPLSSTFVLSARRERGFALLIVLWTMVLLTLLVMDVTASGRTEAELASNLRTRAVLEAKADGLVYEAIFRAMKSPRSPATIQFATDAGTEIQVEDEAGRINPNTASVELLRALIQRVGLNAQASASLAAAVVDWREETSRPWSAKTAQYREAGREYAPPEEPIENIRELSLVLGMTPRILALLAPHLSIYNQGEPDRKFVDPVVAAAIYDVVGDQPINAKSSEGRTLSITATVLGPDGAQFRRHAVVEVGGDWAEAAFRILTWDAESAPVNTVLQQ